MREGAGEEEGGERKKEREVNHYGHTKSDSTNTLILCRLLHSLRIFRALHRRQIGRQSQPRWPRGVSLNSCDHAHSDHTSTQKYKGQEKERKKKNERKKERKRKPAVRAFGSEPRELVPAVVIAVAWNAS